MRTLQLTGITVQVAQALRIKCQKFLSAQLPDNQSDVAQAARAVAAPNEPSDAATYDMQVDQSSQVGVAGVPLGPTIHTSSMLRSLQGTCIPSNCSALLLLGVMAML